MLESDDLAQGSEWRYDVSRMNELRRIDPFYRLFQPLLSVLARMNRVIFPDRLPEIHRQIQAAGLPRFWLPEEYLARMEVLALCCTPLWIYVLYWIAGSDGMLLAPVAVIGTALFLRYRLYVRAAARLRQIKRRMPYLLDLLTLLMEAGATFLNALNQAVDEFRGHPVSEEFGRVLADMNLGKTRMEAFQAMRDRLADDEITSIIGTIIQGEHLGTPLARIFRSQADVLRVKRLAAGGVDRGRGGRKHAHARGARDGRYGADHPWTVFIELPEIRIGDLDVGWDKLRGTRAAGRMPAHQKANLVGRRRYAILSHPTNCKQQMPVKTQCPRCKQPLSVPSKLAGSYANCPRCQGRFWISKDAPADAGSDSVNLSGSTLILTQAAAGQTAAAAPP